MTDRVSSTAGSPGDGDRPADFDPDAITPLPGEPGIPDIAARPRVAVSRKGLLAVGLLALLLVAITAFGIQRFAGVGSRAAEDSKRAGDQPAAETTQPRKLELPVARAASTPVPAVPMMPTVPRIPAIVPTAEEMAEPIGVRRSGTGGAGARNAQAPSPEDAPAVLVFTRPGTAAPTGSSQGGDADPEPDPNDPLAGTTRNLQNYQRQLQGLLDALTSSTASATGQGSAGGGSLVGGTPIGVPPSGGPPTGVSPSAGGSLFGGQLQSSATPRVSAAMLGNRSLTLPKGTAFTCALKTKVISATSGLVGCQVQRNVFSDDGRVLLIERGSHLDGEYRITSVRAGMVRIPVLWTRIRTPHGVTVDVESPATGPLGESGIDGYVDNRWGERLGAAMLLSLIDDSVKLVIQNQSHDTQANTFVLPSTTANTSKLAEKVLDSTINIPPLIYQNQGGIVGIYVARDVDFSSVYELQAVQR